MNIARILGQILLWAGFLSAALATVSNREFDSLSDAEQTSLNRLPSRMSITKSQLETITSKSISELSQEELDDVVTKVIPIAKKNAEEAEKAAEDTNQENETKSETEEEQEEEKKLGYSHFEKQRTTNIENKWATVPWAWYIVSMLIGVVGVVLLRSTSKSAEQETGRVDDEYSTIKSTLESLNYNVSALKKNLEKMKPAEVVHYIDDNCAETFSDFADARNALIQRFGLQAYAEVMTQFASAERFVNRSWSAAADGYMSEVADCVARAEAHLKKADELVLGYEKEKINET